jgi:hypothetical protein
MGLAKYTFCRVIARQVTRLAFSKKEIKNDEEEFFIIYGFRSDVYGYRREKIDMCLIL